VTWIKATKTEEVRNELDKNKVMDNIIIISFILTYATYEICKRIPRIRFLFGIKKVHVNPTPPRA